MSGKQQGAKAGRREKHLARAAALKERKRLRKARAAKFAHLPGQQPTHGADRFAATSDKLPLPALDNMSVGRLREIAKGKGCKVLSRHRKADLIAMIENAYEARS